ncbi:MAG: hypothetical protein LC772_03730 [Chloroflexi bacterium]|nr:hypothetical protein [Chloroflexota bacterium]
MRFRAVIIGLLMSVLIVGMTQALSIQRDAAEVGGGAPAPAPVYLLFSYVLVFAPLLSGRLRRLALSRRELMLIYAMMLVAGPITHPYAIGFLIPHVVSPLYYNAEEPGWSVFQTVLPRWMAPGDPAAIRTFFRGGTGAVPWAAWLIPMLAWSSLLIVLFYVMLCINVLMRRQWVDHERLTFPLAAIPLALAEGTQDADSTFRHPLRILHQPLFWPGVALPLVLQAPHALHRYLPQIIDLPLKDVTMLDGTILPGAWRGLGRIEIDIIFWLIGIAYLLPKEITLSACLFYGIRLLENVLAVGINAAGDAPSVYSNDFPALFAQGAGAAFALAGLVLWTGRGHLAAVFRTAFGGQAASSAEQDAAIPERLSYRAAILGAAGGIVFILGWMCVAGMRLWVAGLFLGLMLTYFFIFARIRAEAGLGMSVILWPKMLDEVLVTLVGARSLHLSELTAIYAMRWLYFGSATGSVMACQLEGFKLAESVGLDSARFGKALLLATSITVPMAFAWTLVTYYGHGFESLSIGQRSTSMVASQIYWSFEDLVATHATAAGPDWRGIAAVLAGALITLALSALRMRFLWFPLHPVGYLAANSWGMHINWAPFLIGWLLNSLITRYGGMSAYRRLLPIFLGLVVGDMLHEGVWGAIAWLTGATQ